jgi:hypothetical protein
MGMMIPAVSAEPMRAAMKATRRERSAGTGSKPADLETRCSSLRRLLFQAGYYFRLKSSTQNALGRSIRQSFVFRRIRG